MCVCVSVSVCLRVSLCLYACTSVWVGVGGGGFGWARGWAGGQGSSWRQIRGIQTFEDITFQELAEDDSMAMCLATLKYLKGNFKRHEREEEYLYDALALAQRTGEKQQASPIELVSVFSEAIRLKKKSLGAKSTRDLLNLCVQDYNKVVGKAMGPSRSKS